MPSLADDSVALGALDGRYRPVIAPLIDHLSEPALNRERLRVEVEWLIHLTQNDIIPGAPTLTKQEQEQLRRLVTDFGADDIAALGEIERVTQHDVKAIEYFLKERLAAIAPASSERLGELIHL